MSVDIQYAPKQVEVINLNFDDLVYSSFQGAVWVDVANGFPDEGSPNVPNGNTERPVNNIQLAVTIAQERGFRTIQVIGDLALGAGDDVREFHIIGTSHVHDVITVGADCMCNKTKFSSFQISGKLDGDSEITDCVVGDLTYFNGHVHDSMLDGVITLDGNANAIIDDCAMLNILNVPVIDCNYSNQNLVMTNFSGSLKLINSGINNNIGIGSDAIDLEIDASCSDGIIAVSGTGSVKDNSTGDCYVINKIIDGSELQNLKVMIEQLRPHHTGGGKMIFWDVINGSDIHHGDSPDRAFKTFARCHDVATNAGHDTIVIVPGDESGVTTITEPINVTKDYLFIRGPGRDVIVKQGVLNNTLVTSARGTEFSGFRVQNTIPGGVGLYSTGAFTLAENLWFEDCDKGASFASDHPIINRCKVFNAEVYGIKMSGAIETGEITGCNICGSTSVGLEIDVDPGQGCVEMSDTVIVGSGGYGIELSSTTSNFIGKTGNVLMNNAQGNVMDLGTNNIVNTESSAPTAAENANAVFAKIV